MAQTAEAMQVHVRGRRPGLPTLDSRLEELETMLGKSKISNRRLSEMHEAALTLEHHYSGHKENGEKVNPQLKRVQAVLDNLVARVDLPTTNGTKTSEPEVQGSTEPEALDRIRRIRKQRQEVLNRLTELQRQEEELYPEIGRLVVEEALGQPA